jgi:lipoate-protein ligase B
MEVLDLGLTEYFEAWELQRKAQRALIDGTGPELLIITEHLPTITLGKSAKASHVLAPPETLRARGISTFEVERGGDVTYHGPGQLVAYPIINLSSRRRDVDWYMRLLEGAIIRSLNEWSVPSFRIKGRTGVWVGKSTDSEAALDGSSGEPRKIASLGVRLSRWCTMHGLAVNIASRHPYLSLEEGFSLINPCGLGPVTITSLASERAPNDGSFSADPVELMDKFKSRITDCLLEVLSIELGKA